MITFKELTEEEQTGAEIEREHIVKFIRAYQGLLEGALREIEDGEHWEWKPKKRSVRIRGGVLRNGRPKQT